jgi:hypothetical protein
MIQSKKGYQSHLDEVKKRSDVSVSLYLPKNDFNCSSFKFSNCTDTLNEKIHKMEVNCDGSLLCIAGNSHLRLFTITHDKG